MRSPSAVAAWRAVARVLAEHPGRSAHLPLTVPHPSRAGMRRSLGLPRGQAADYRGELSGGRCLHVRTFVDHYVAHVDQVDPGRDVLGHLRADVPGLYLAGLAATAGALGARMGGWRGALAGLLAGCLAGALHVGARRSVMSPAPAELDN